MQQDPAFRNLEIPHKQPPEQGSLIEIARGVQWFRLPLPYRLDHVNIYLIESDDGYGPYGAKSIGESSKVPAVAAVANAIFNAIGRRMKDLPITRDKILGALA